MADEIVIPEKTKITIDGTRYQLAVDAPAFADSVEVKRQKNPRIGFACSAEPCATLQREKNRNKLMIVWTTPGPCGKLWPPSCGNPDCGLPMSVINDPRDSETD
jgi:hypothetical protein